MDIRSYGEEELTEIAEIFGEKSFRGKQLFDWIHGKQAVSFDEMSNLPAGFREKLKETYPISTLKIVDKQVAKSRDTAKYLFALPDGNVIESVWMKYHHGNSVCISSQIGCRMGCTFCASTLMGLERSLTAGEMLSQIYEIQRETGERVSNVIVMGMGEPLDNYDNLVRFIRLISSDKGICISQRNITVSTCGLTERIRDLMKEHFQITLAISLHAPNDEIRKQTMPVAKKHSIEEIFQVCREYFEVTGRRITFEYSMIRGVNDREEHAKELARRCKGQNCHINLIPLNEVKERNCLRSEDSDIQRFKIILEKNRINVTIRREMGSDIDAACGQLRKKFLSRTGKN
ncbi:MAG: 23S rRNA (adenine(2503)-C(2))-methyltransferase RlmN [Lachnospiraceae bacterium]|nr:23S rRNA (adenine(2503)-C(2))-methyltransferase RlmN [Lachnospiraceae bacterium]